MDYNAPINYMIWANPDEYRLKAAIDHYIDNHCETFKGSCETIMEQEEKIKKE